MKSIVLKTLARVDKKSTLDTIKSVLKEECEKAKFEVTDKDFSDMLTEVLYGLI